VKICTKCKTGQDFYRDIDSWCKECLKAYSKEYRNTKSKEGKSVTKLAIEKKPEKYNKDYFQKASRKSRLKRLYGISENEYIKMLEDQDGRCAICKVSGGLISGSFLSVDHNHSTGAIRGLLCSRCNTALGMLEDSLDNLEAAKIYLQRDTIK
jgi:hypothetical protein